MIDQDKMMVDPDAINFTAFSKPRKFVLACR